MTEAGPDIARMGRGRFDALYTDMGGVLVRIRADRFFGRLDEHAPGIESDRFYREVLGSDLYAGFCTGRIGAREFGSAMAAILGIEWDHGTFRDVWTDMFDPIPGTREAFERAVGILPVHVLSNTDPVHWEHIIGRFPFLSLATSTHLSFDVGLMKPDSRYYTLALERHDLDPARVLFVDDREENVRAARAVGLVAVRMSDESVFRRVVDALESPSGP